MGAVLVGCGGSDDEAAISNQEFAKKGNVVCVTTNKKAAAELQQAMKRPELANAKSEGEGIRGEVTHLVPILITEAEAQHDGIQKLGMPDGREAEIEGLLGAYTTWIKKAETSPLKIVIANDIFNKARELAAKAGLKECLPTPFQVI